MQEPIGDVETDAQADDETHKESKATPRYFLWGIGSGLFDDILCRESLRKVVHAAFFLRFGR